jgi:tetratricopeptide (TPR) repeat protein
MNKISQKIFVFSLAIILVNISIAQKTFLRNDPYKNYKIAQELFDKEKYSSAQYYFKDVINKFNNPQDELRINAEYYFAVCALKLYHRNVETILTRFSLDHPDHPKAKNIYFQLGKHYYQTKKFKKSIEFFEKVDQYDLSSEDQSEYLFKLGYSKFMTKNLSESKVIFNDLLQKKTDYSVPATYYYSHIAYDEGKYQTALVGFRKIANNKMFKAIIPYYITQILYQQYKYDELIEYGSLYIDSVTEKRKGEFAKLIGDSYFKKNKYESSLEYYKIFKRNAKSNRESNYQVGYCYYQTKKYKKAIEIFSRIATVDDSLTQISYYHMADSYLILEQKDYARNAFQKASKLNFDLDIRRNSLFNYAKLAYELSYNPYDEAINAFQQFIENFPNSEDAKEAYDFLLKVYLTTKNYDDALASMDKIKNKDPRMQKAYQTIVYNRAVEQYHNREYKNAITNFERVKKYPIDQNLNAMSQFWIGECNYNLKEYLKAVESYEKFRFINGAILTNEFLDLDFHIGYSYFEKANPYENLSGNEAKNQKEELRNALKYFRNYIHQYNLPDSNNYKIALLRIADTYFLLREDSLAIENYTLSLNIGNGNHSYALNQMATSQGLIQDYKGKINTLKRLTNQYPNSKYQVYSLLNLAQAYKDENRNIESLNTYLKFINEYPNNNLISKAYVELGSISLKEKNHEEAEKFLLTVMDNYPDAEQENQLATELMMEVYNLRGDLKGYYDWLSIRGIDVSIKEKDSTLWKAVVLARDNGDCKKQIEKASYYLDNIDQPVREISAHYFMANCYYSENKKTQALFHYDYVSTKPNNNYYIEALKYAGEITYDAKDFKKSLGYFSILEDVSIDQEDLSISKKGQFYCFHYLDNPISTIKYAKKILLLSDLNNKLKEDAYLFLGKSYQKINQLDSAKLYYDSVVQFTKSIAAAEAKYHVCEIAYKREDYKSCEFLIMELVKQKPSYDYWLARGILLLGDNFTAQKDYFNAKHSVESVLDNYDGDKKGEVLAAAVQKLDYIKSLEINELQQQPEQEELEIELERIYKDLENNPEVLNLNKVDLKGIKKDENK